MDNTVESNDSSDTCQRMELALVSFHGFQAKGKAAFRACFKNWQYKPESKLKIKAIPIHIYCGGQNIYCGCLYLSIIMNSRSMISLEWSLIQLVRIFVSTKNLEQRRAKVITASNMENWPPFAHKNMRIYRVNFTLKSLLFPPHRFWSVKLEFYKKKDIKHFLRTFYLILW